MTQTHSFANEFPGNWRLMGELKLPAGSTGHDNISTWLVETLRPLDLNGRFLNKILASAEAAAGDGDARVDDASHVHMLIYTPEESHSNGQSWGFFRVEKKGDPNSADHRHDHAIAFYLYREGA